MPIIYTQSQVVRTGLVVIGILAYSWSQCLNSAIADGSVESSDVSNEGAKMTVPSTNFGKTKNFLPGEEVVTATGKTVKVWSTEGPVPVRRAPEPFRDRAQGQFPRNAHIVVDEALINHYSHNQGSQHAPGGFLPSAPHANGFQNQDVGVAGIDNTVENTVEEKTGNDITLPDPSDSFEALPTSR